MPKKILIAEDNPQNMELILMTLRPHGYHLLEATDGEKVLDVISKEKPDLILMDIQLPIIDGLEVARRLRQMPGFNHIPIIALTAYAMEEDKERIIKAGCDAYLAKPFSTRELVARVKTVLRRVGKAGEAKTSILIKAHHFQVNQSHHTATWKQVALDLSNLEFELLVTLLRHPGNVLSREQLLDQVWGYAYPGDTRTVDTAIKRLRQKLRRVDPQASAMIETVRGVGYRAQAEDSR